ncbi:kinase-like protein, partial [Auricularia subglabra TFB-10046 SS5]
YRPGGYHPLVLGDTLSHGRYTIMSKLGWGTYSTVWFARDKQRAQFVAIKIVVANSPPSAECAIRERLVRAGQSHPGACHVQRLVNSFFEYGPNGTHECIVSVPGGHSLLSAKRYPVDFIWLFPLEVARAMAAQMILAVAFVHSEGVVHGDLHPGNFILRLPQSILALSSEDYLRDYQPVTVPIVRWDGKPLTTSVPQYAVPEYGIGDACHRTKLCDAGILLTDFGAAWAPAEEDRFTTCAPTNYLPPEALFAVPEQRPLGPAADIWTLAHSLYALFGKYSLFPPLRSEHGTFAEAIDMLGRPPARWWNSWTARGKFFNDAGEWDVKPPRGAPCGGTLAKRMLKMRRERKDFDDETGVVLCDAEAADLEAMLGRMLDWEPDDRITAEELTECTWMRNWGTPAMDKVPGDELCA